MGQRLQDQGAELSAINDYVARGNAGLKEAEEIARVSRTILGQTNAARDKALKVGADRLGAPFMDVENQYLKLTKAIENDNLSYARKHADRVQAAFREVEIMAIKNNAIGKARQMMAEADQARIRKIAPTAYDDALQALNEAAADIGQNPYQAEAVKTCLVANRTLPADRIRATGYGPTARWRRTRHRKAGRSTAASMC